MLSDRLLAIGRRKAAYPSEVADAALVNARELCEVAGPWQIAADYGAMPDASLPEIAENFAQVAYADDEGVQSAAKAGALAGFDRYLADHPQDPYD